MIPDYKLKKYIDTFPTNEEEIGKFTLFPFKTEIKSGTIHI